jgi:hypothetical protein
MANIINTKNKGYVDLVQATPSSKLSSGTLTIFENAQSALTDEGLPICSQKISGAYVNLAPVDLSTIDKYSDMVLTKLNTWEQIKTKFASKWTFPFPVIAIGWLESVPPQGKTFHYKYTNNKGSLRNGTIPKWVVIHHTGGTAANDDPTSVYRSVWNPAETGSDFCLSRGGRIAGMVDFRKKSSGHYGEATFAGVGGLMNRQSIAIETIGYGQCMRCSKDNRAYNNLGATYLYDAWGTLYKKDILKKQVYKTAAPYRNYQLWHVHTDEQIFAIANLIVALAMGGAMSDYNTFIQNIKGTSRFNTLFPNDGLTTPPPPGVITHGTGRGKLGKVDIFPQENLIQMLDDLPNIIARGGSLFASSTSKPPPLDKKYSKDNPPYDDLKKFATPALIARILKEAEGNINDYEAWAEAAFYEAVRKGEENYNAVKKALGQDPYQYVLSYMPIGKGGSVKEVFRKDKGDGRSIYDLNQAYINREFYTTPTTSSLPAKNDPNFNIKWIYADEIPAYFKKWPAKLDRSL